MLCFYRSNSWATTSILKPSPWKSPTQTDRRRNESAWQKRRSRLLPSSAFRHFTLISGETTSLFLIHEDIASAMGYGPFFPVPKNSDAYIHTHTHRIGEQLTVEPMRCSCFLRKSASLLGQEQRKHILYTKTHVDVQHSAVTQRCGRSFTRTQC